MIQMRLLSLGMESMSLVKPPVRQEAVTGHSCRLTYLFLRPTTVRGSRRFVGLLWYGPRTISRGKAKRAVPSPTTEELGTQTYAGSTSRLPLVELSLVLLIVAGCSIKMYPHARNSLQILRATLTKRMCAAVHLGSAPERPDCRLLAPGMARE